MHRRTVLAGVGIGLLTGTGGCIGRLGADDAEPPAYEVVNRGYYSVYSPQFGLITDQETVDRYATDGETVDPFIQETNFEKDFLVILNDTGGPPTTYELQHFELGSNDVLNIDLWRKRNSDLLPLTLSGAIIRFRDMPAPKNGARMMLRYEWKDWEREFIETELPWGTIIHSGF